MSDTSYIETKNGKSYRIYSYNVGYSTEKHEVRHSGGGNRHVGTTTTLEKALVLIKADSGSEIRSIS